MNIDISATTEQHHEISRPEAYALYHLPDTADFTYIAQHDAPGTVASFAALEGKQGFVAAPFHITPGTPVVLIHPDILVRYPLAAAGEFHQPFIPMGRQAPGGGNAGQRKAYTAGFAVCKRHLAEGLVRKVVYARCESQPLAPEDRQSPLHLFMEACRRYPHSYVGMWYTPQTGCWLTATPETLLAADTIAPHRWHTMSLAGTMPHTPEALSIGAWSSKNKTEQALVTEFIVQQLAGIADDLRLSEVYPIPVANVVHLRTDLSFSLRNGIGLGTLLNRLHPTPAVCGTPRTAALSAIAAAEHTPRRYYAGFSGPLSLHGHTSFYVSLRCMELLQGQASLYAGGGLLPASTEEAEWEETCRKLHTMKNLLTSPLLADKHR